MPRKKAVKVRKWVTCAEPGCKRRAGTSGLYCGEHQKKWEKKHAAAYKGDTARQKTAAAARRKETSEEVRKKLKRDSAAKRKGGRRAVDSKKGKGGKVKRTPFPRAGLIKDPGSRLIKAHCEKCNYTIRLSRKWIEVKLPICPVCMKNMATELDNAAPDPRQLKLKGGV
jgi:hypothetical protein